MCPIVLVGYRASGKSTVARVLGQRLGLPHDDMDALIEKRAGNAIAHHI